MSIKWDDVPDAPPPKVSVLGYLVVALRVVFLLGVLFLGLALLAVLRTVDFVFGSYLHVWPAQLVCRACLLTIGLGLRVHGRQNPRARLLAANHSSWLDVLVLNGAIKAQFIAKDDVRSWPGMGLLARVTGTVFISRERLAAKRQLEELMIAIAGGKRLILFPEGTTTDGRHLAPFRSSMLQMCFDPRWQADWPIQAVTVVYHPPKGEAETFYGWWGEMELGPSMLAILARLRQGHVDVYFHPVTTAQEHGGRKSLTDALENDVTSQAALLRRTQ